MNDTFEEPLTEQQQNILDVLKKEGYQTVTQINNIVGGKFEDIRKDLAVLMSKGFVFNIYKVHVVSLYIYRGYLKTLLASVPCPGEGEEQEGCDIVEENSPIQLTTTTRLRLTGRPLNKETLSIPLEVPFMTINHEVGWNRVIVLRRIRDRLMKEYHPVLNAVISDYENMLKLFED